MNVYKIYYHRLYNLWRMTWYHVISNSDDKVVVAVITAAITDSNGHSVDSASPFDDEVHESVNIFNFRCRQELAGTGMLSGRFSYLVAVSAANMRLGLHCRPFVSSLATGKTVTMSYAGYGHLKLHPCLSDRLAIANISQPKRYASDGRPPLPPSSPTPPPPEQPIIDDDKSQNIFQRFKNMAKKYWYIVLPVHLVTSTVWFGSFYLVASCGVDVPGLMESFGFPDWIIDKVRNGNSWTSYMLIAYGLYKIFTPLRYMVTLGGVGMTIRYLQKFGYVINSSGMPKKP